MSDTQIPIACTLNDAAFRERERVILTKFKAAVRSARATTSGHVFGFDPNEGILPDLCEFIDLERQCCPFIDFTLKVERGGNITLELAGPEGAKEFIAATFAP